MTQDYLSIPVKQPHLDSSLMDEIEYIYAGNNLDDDSKFKMVCTKSWLNIFEKD